MGWTAFVPPRFNLSRRSAFRAAGLVLPATNARLLFDNRKLGPASVAHCRRRRKESLISSTIDIAPSSFVSDFGLRLPPPPSGPPPCSFPAAPTTPYTCNAGRQLTSLSRPGGLTTTTFYYDYQRHCTYTFLPDATLTYIHYPVSSNVSFQYDAPAATSDAHYLWTEPAEFVKMPA